MVNRLLHKALRLASGGNHYSPAQAEKAMARCICVADELKQWANGGFHEAISLGQNCSSSWYIKECGLKKASYPFDWLATNARVLEHVLRDDFSTLLDRRQMVSLLTEGGHSFYHSRMIGHRNPARNNADYAYFQRCVERWRAMMASRQRVLFLTVILNEYEKRTRVSRWFADAFQLPKSQTIDHYKPVVELIAAKNPNAQFLFIEQYTDGPFALEIQVKDDNLLWLKFTTQGANSGVMYLDPIDDALMRKLMEAVQKPA